MGNHGSTSWLEVFAQQPGSESPDNIVGLAFLSDAERGAFEVELGRQLLNSEGGYTFYSAAHTTSVLVCLTPNVVRFNTTILSAYERFTRNKVTLRSPSPDANAMEHRDSEHARTNRFLKAVSFLIPRKMRELVCGDILEDVKEQRKAGYGEWRIRFTVCWQFFFALHGHVAVFVAWLVATVRKIIPG